MKKRIILPILTLAAVFATSNFSQSSAFAETATDEQGTLWTLSEAQSLYDEFEARRTADCGDNYACRRTYWNTLRQEDPKYNVAGNFGRSTFIITAINPEENYIRVLFRDLDYNRWETRAQEVHRVLTELYLCHR